MNNNELVDLTSAVVQFKKQFNFNKKINKYKVLEDNGYYLTLKLLYSRNKKILYNIHRGFINLIHF